MIFSIKKNYPHLLAILGFVILSLGYFYPVLKGESILQSDIVQYKGMAKQQTDYRAKTGKETYWTNSAFGGMPTYQLGARYPYNYIKKLDSAIRFLPRPADYLFLYLLGFYVLLIVLKIDYKLAILGALAFGFSTYLIIILGVGHNSKAHAIGYMPFVLAGVLLTFRRRYVLGFFVTAIAMGLELVANHFQMTYYLGMLVIILGIAYFVDAYKKQGLPHFFKSVGILFVAVLWGIGMNATNILATQEYVQASTRGKGELTINPDGSPKKAQTGLSNAYITTYSYGFFESLNLFIPRLTGGGNGENMGQDSKTYEAYRKLGASPSVALQASKRAPLYWGDQPIVEAPAYVGAVILFLFVIGLLLVKGRTRWWLLAGTLLSLALSYGKNLGFLTDFFIDYVPLYNKFRAVTSIQVILELCVPVLAILGLTNICTSKSKKDKIKALKTATLITGGIAVLLLIFKSSFDFVGINDGFYRQNYGPDFIEALRADRSDVFTNDIIRSLLLVLLSAGLLYRYLLGKLKQGLLLIVLGGLIIFDLVGVDRRYVNADDFVPKTTVETPYQMNAADRQIRKDTSYYRVFDLVASGARASYFHNSLTGYHAAKLRRYQDIFDFYISQNNMPVLNMLNTKYLINQDDKGHMRSYQNTDANGNAWFVQSVEKLNTPDEAIQALKNVDTKNKAIYTVMPSKEKAYKTLKTHYEVDSQAQIKLLKHQPNYLEYKSKNPRAGFAVFSEIYYDKGWHAYIDGKEVPHIRVNYILRGLSIPSGEHTIVFKFTPDVVTTGSQIALASSLGLILLLLVGLGYAFKKSH